MNALVFNPQDIWEHKMITADIDTTNMCPHLRHKLMDNDGIYHHLWQQINDDQELTAVVRFRQLHIYRNGKKVLVLKGKAEPQVIREDAICHLLKEKEGFKLENDDEPTIYV